MSIRPVCLAAMLSVLACGSANAAVISTYTDRTAWEAALAGAVFSQEGFGGDAVSFDANSSGNLIGDISVELIGGVGDPGPTGLTGSGFFQAEVDSRAVDSDQGLSVALHYQPFMGFGLLGLQNDNISNPASLDLQELALSVAGDYFLITDLLGLTDSANMTGSIPVIENDTAIPFIGFVLDVPISSFTFVHADLAYADGVSGATEEFYLDGLVFASAGTGQRMMRQLPEPSVLVLMLSGLALLGRRYW